MIDWSSIERDVVARIRALAAIDAECEARGEEFGGCVRRDLIAPAARKLAEFCACVEIGEEDKQ